MSHFCSTWGPSWEKWSRQYPLSSKIVCLHKEFKISAYGQFPIRMHFSDLVFHLFLSSPSCLAYLIYAVANICTREQYSTFSSWTRLQGVVITPLRHLVDSDLTPHMPFLLKTTIIFLGEALLASSCAPLIQLFSISFGKSILILLVWGLWFVCDNFLI